MAVERQELVRYDMAIGGEHVAAVDGRTFESIDPFAGEAWATAPDAGPADVDRAVRAAQDALSGPWGAMAGRDRARLLRRLGDLVQRDAEELCDLEVRDNGKLRRDALAQVGAVADWFHFFSGLADKVHGESMSPSPGYLAYTRHEPVGVVAAIVPWNAPLILLTWKLAPALAAGCTVVVKPSEHTPVTALALADRFEEAGFPPGVINVVTGFGPVTGQALTAHPLVAKVAFTGSTATGIAVAQSAMGHLAQVSLELGGKSPQVVFEDADLAGAANGIVAGVYAASGQTCMAGSRVVAHRSVHDELVERIAARAETIRVGDPRLVETDMGPISTQPQFERVSGLVERAAGEGARVASGGGPADGGGFLYRPTLLTDVTPTMEIFREEVFGPVTVVVPFDTEDEAVALANDTDYGLAGAVWTLDVRRAHRVAHRIKAGTVWINAYRVTHPGVPFGGYKTSGIGRENGVDALREFTETKAVWVELTGDLRDPFTIG